MKIKTTQNPSLAYLLVLGGLIAVRAVAQQVPHLTTTNVGGFPGIPFMTGIERTTNGVRLSWDGPSGFYQLYQKSGVSSSVWQKYGSPNLSRSTNIPATAASAFFKVAGPPARYAGSAVCSECHEGVHQTEVQTRHASAFIDPQFVAMGGQTNSSCLPCHTVGYGLPTGFINAATTPHLAGVQCENCHGPAANHAANELDFTARPRAELAGELCGGCHNERSHRPIYEQWKSSGHYAVVEDMNPANRISRCGRCHSGSSRLALIQGKNPSVAVTNDANVGITCVVCHDPHATRAETNLLAGVFAFTNKLTGLTTPVTNLQVGATYTNQLRYPFASTKDYYLTTSADFASNYDTNINVCAQCHNHRGAAWSSTSFPPHHSPQYNMLLGTVGELEGITAPDFPSTHSRLEKQCVGCHVPKVGDGSEAHPFFSGHTFKVESLNLCRQCHPAPELILTFATNAIASQIRQVKKDLDFWAAVKAPDSLWAKYGVRAWEYTNLGDLSSGDSGPDSDEQNLIPDNIKKARFNLYLVKYDGSYGVHNGPYAVSLLDTARTLIEMELNE